ncbi:55398a7c-66ca-4295-a280-d1404843e626-CDS [Sclerotinia trifoliorum]|uniref:55398a7c-66ca-4295-a280-d1404843e626-CDS n=1 Tax=Sclerotinia trifoliorum TaxID=28548 RepID=A0A8H2W3T0_9HELO|nr:55398a7c-66ca-4295-a280-d1404843e626-CDS [Sclerotinia trifoliorum]
MATLIHSRRGTVTRLRRHSQSPSDSDEDVYTAPLTPPVSPQYPLGRYPGQWSLGLQLKNLIFSRLVLFTIGSILTYSALFCQDGSVLGDTEDISGIDPKITSAIPLLYKDFIYNATKREGNTLKGHLDIFPGNTLSVARRFAKALPDYQQARAFSVLLEDLQITSDEIYHEYMHYYDSIRRHAEDAMILTNALVEDSEEVCRYQNVSDTVIMRTQDFKHLTDKRSYWFYPSTCGFRGMGIKAKYLEYLKALREGFNQADWNFYNHKFKGLTEVLRTGARLMSLFEEARTKSEVLQSAVEHGISTLSSDGTSTLEHNTNQSNEIIGYIENWLKNDFERGRIVREIEMPISVHKSQLALKAIDRKIREVVNILLHMENFLNDHWHVNCHIDAMANTLQNVSSYYNFNHPSHPMLVWEMYRSIWRRESTGPLIDPETCNTQQSWITHG